MVSALRWQADAVQADVPRGGRVRQGGLGGVWEQRGAAGGGPGAGLRARGAADGAWRGRGRIEGRKDGLTGSVLVHSTDLKERMNMGPELAGEGVFGVGR